MISFYKTFSFISQVITLIRLNFVVKNIVTKAHRAGVIILTYTMKRFLYVSDSLLSPV